MWKKMLVLSLLPLSLSGRPTSLIRLEEGSIQGLSGPLQADGFFLSQESGRHNGSRARTLGLRNRGENQHRELRIELVPGGGKAGGPRLALSTLSRDTQLTLGWRAAAAGQTCQICLQNTSWGDLLCAEVQAQAKGWQEIAIPFVGGKEALARQPQAQPLEAGLLILRPMNGLKGDGEIAISKLQLGGSGIAPDTEKVGQAFGASSDQVEAMRALGLPEDLTWMLLILDQRCHCGPTGFSAQRANKSWGEISKAQGWAWGDLLQEMRYRRNTAGLEIPDASSDQRDRVSRNDIALEGRP